MPFVASRVLYDAEGLLVVDKPPGLVVHGGDEALSGDLVSRLAAHRRAQGRDDYLGVHQRLDAPTSGVMLFTTARERNAEVAAAVAEHRLGRRYVAGVTLRSTALAARLAAGPERLEHRLATDRGETRVVAAGGVKAAARVELVERVGARALVALEPETGRTHQLRVQLAHEGAPIGGDADYGGDRAPRLLLHSSELTLGELTFETAPPGALARWVRGEPASLGDARELARAVEDAAVLRAPLASFTDAYRLANELGDGLPGVTIDRYGDFAVLVATSDEAGRRASEIAEVLLELGARGVYLKRRRKLDARRADATLAPEAPLAGEPAPERLLVSERGVRLWVELGRGLSTGLFVDQRENRRRVRELAKGARVLNLFCYTSSFGVAAALGGAREVVSVDSSAPALARARENFGVNGVGDSAHRFEHADALDWLARAARRGTRFDIVVLDPPTFSSSAGGAPFAVGEHYAGAAARALGVLAPGGRLFAVTNHRKTSRGRLREIVRRAAAEARVDVAQLKDLPAAFDCPDGPDGPVPSKSVLLTRK